MDTNNRFNTNAVWMTTSISGQETLTLSYYNGGCSLTVFPRGGSGSRKPLIKISLSSDGVIVLREALTRLLEAQPDTRESFEKSSYDKETRSSKVEATIVLVKDNKRNCLLELTGRGLHEPLSFKIMAAQSFSHNGTPFSEEERSRLKVRHLIDVLKNDYMTRMLSNFNADKRQFGGNNNNSKGNYQKSNYNNPDNNYSGNNDFDDFS